MHSCLFLLSTCYVRREEEGDRERRPESRLAGQEKFLGESDLQCTFKEKNRYFAREFTFKGKVLYFFLIIYSELSSTKISQRGGHVH